MANLQFVDEQSTQLVLRAVIDDQSSGDNEIIPQPGAGKKIRVHNIVLISAGTVNVRFEDGAGGTPLTGQISLVANTGFAPGFDPVGHFECSENTALNLELNGAVSVDGWIVYQEVSTS